MKPTEEGEWTIYNFVIEVVDNIVVEEFGAENVKERDAGEGVQVK